MGWVKQPVSIDGQEYRAAIKSKDGEPVRMEVYGASAGDIKPGSTVEIGKASYLCARPKEREGGAWLEIALKPAPKPKAAKKEANHDDKPDGGSDSPDDEQR